MINKDDKKEDCFVPLSQGGDILKEGFEAPMNMPFRHYITLSPLVECHIRNIEFKAEEWVKSPGGTNEYIGESRAGWIPGGPNLTWFTDATNVNYKHDTEKEMPECGILYPSTMLWEAYGIYLSNMVQPPMHFWKNRKYESVLINEQGQDITDAELKVGSVAGGA